ncbi:hypothetical protein GJAV_G00172600 [Gymnothorax javanicus]|nr:hypothetical protein GJAV_G00172600 [Gymnothorax javanicus]
MESCDIEAPSGTEGISSGRSEICFSSLKSDTGLASDDVGAGTDLTASPSSLDFEKSSSEVDRSMQSSVEFWPTSQSHEVIFTVSFVLAIHKGGEDDPSNDTENSKGKERSMMSSGLFEVPKSLGYYHIEYNLLPDDPEPTKVDVVVYGLVAKVYLENDTKVFKLWQEGEKTWLGWTQSVKVKVTRDMVLKLASHKVTFRVWDTKDRVSTKAKSDRPRAFRLPRKRLEDPDHSGGVKAVVQKLRILCQKETPRTTSSPKMLRNPPSAETSSVLKRAAVKPKQTTVEALAGERASALTTVNMDSSAASTNRPLGREEERESLLPDWKSQKLKAIQELIEGPPKQRPVLQRPWSRTVVSRKKPSCVRNKPQILPKTKNAKKTTKESMVLSEKIKKSGIASVALSVLCFIAGDRTVTDCLVPCFPGACEGICSISTDRQLLSDALREELNPLVIRILSVSSLPTAPVPYHVLKEKCLPVYCQYKFHKMNVHRTKGREHGTHVYFRDVNVILTGLLSRGELGECLGGPPLTIEVHDRDRRNTEDPSCGPALVGAEPGYNQPSSARTTHHNGIMRNPCGIAKLDLSDLLHGQKCLKMSVPITGSAPLDSARQDADRVHADEPTEPPMPMGLYHDFNSVLKVLVEIARPLRQLRRSPDEHLEDCPFGRIIYVFSFRNTAALTRLRSEVLKINGAAFEMDTHSEETIRTALTCYQMSAEDQESKDLDAVTGFHVFDGHKHLFVLEGLRDKAIKRLWEAVPIRLSDIEEEQVEVLYNSAVSFSNRLYGALDLSLRPIHLQKRLETIMRQPKVYLRDTVPPACLHALTRISLLLLMKKLRHVVRSELFPTAEMILSLNQEFGMVPGRGEEKATQVEENEAEEEVFPRCSKTKKLPPLDNYNIEYMEWKEQLENQRLQGNIKDFIQVNMEEVHQASLSIKQRLKQAFLPTSMEIHSFSTRISNCTETQEEQTEERTWRLCRSQEYQQALVEAEEAEASQKACEARSRAAWRTHDGFRVPGFKSSMESNEHPWQVDQARAEELRKPWRENVLHGNILRPPLQRDAWPWVSRSEDFERYRKPQQFFGSMPPVTIHLAGESLRQEQLQYYRDMSEGPAGNKMIPEFRSHVGVAQGSQGKLENLLKDKPMKLSLRRPGMVLKPIPMVSVLQHPEGRRLEVEEREVCQAFSPGALEHHSLSWDSNAVPLHDSLYNKFHYSGYWRPHSFHYKRAAPPLTEDERFAFPIRPPDSPHQTPVQRHPAGNIMETRTYGDIYLHVL